MILKLGMKHLGMQLYKVYMYHDPGMTLTYFTGLPMHLNWNGAQQSLYKS